MLDLVISIVVLAGLALIAGAVVLWRRGDAKNAALMAVLAAVMFVNIAIWMIPAEGGESLADVAGGAQ